MKYDLAEVEIIELSNPALLIQTADELSEDEIAILEKLPQQLTFSYDFYPVAENILPLSITWNYSVFSKAKPIFTCIGITKSAIHIDGRLPPLSDIYEMIRNMFFRYDLEVRSGFQGHDLYCAEIDDLPDNRFFNLASDIKSKLGI